MFDLLYQKFRNSRLKMGGSQISKPETLISRYRKTISGVLCITEHDREFDFMNVLKKALCFAEFANPNIEMLETVVSRINKFIELISSESDNALECISRKLENICRNANIEQTTLEQNAVISSMRRAMVAKKSQKTYEDELSSYEKDVQVAVTTLYELVQKRTSLRNCLTWNN